MAASIKLGQDIVWGTTSAAGTGSAALGKIISIESKSTSKVHEQPDEDGELYSMVMFDQKEEITVEILAKPSVTKPAVGSTLTIAGVTDAIVMDSTEKWANQEGKKFSLTLMKSTA